MADHSYLLALPLIVPLSSYLKHRFAAKQLFITAITLFTAATVFAALAPNFAALLDGFIVDTYGWRTIFWTILPLLIAAFCHRCRRIAQPLIHIGIFHQRAFVLSAAFIVITQFCVLAIGYIVPSYAQPVSQSSATIAGFLLFPAA